MRICYYFIATISKNQGHRQLVFQESQEVQVWFAFFFLSNPGAPG